MFLLVDNFDSFTFNLVQAFQQLGAEPLVLRNDREDILELAESGKLKRVCLSPGPSRPENAGLSLEFLSRLSKDVPVLGVCLGHQTLGYHGGASIVRAGRIMHGKTSAVFHKKEGLFSGMDDPFQVCRYHSLVVNVDEAPDMMELTAWTGQREVMGMRYKDRPWAGVQFHPESILTPDGPKLLKNFLDGNI
ncbi:anthranilate synthase component II [Maridesulfovibrio hydrothermalis]|uniref:4-amino-4-deoxychorismate synthase anthranilate synthase (Subunit II) n=1 Tax=Maridesulfovibrio hydrothermalis AM13 = DSM 14728 TaxID=1121451 RepID=L0RE27_9BACT|nr:aminodeoxychorismate/anthranilate synthase component II [Maridesulfovibrio hydrothermalis]CCO23831.1 4-amino-4-deoxychorismate synthase; anthranilate synthase (subunit II) [Maridesulfovibrio hydrothermalis AM13 = DSM 14728]